MVYLVFLGGVFIGAIITCVIHQKTSAHGYFTVTPYSDDEIAVDEGILFRESILAKRCKPREIKAGLSYIIPIRTNNSFFYGNVLIYF